jgi:iron complex outermembrane receptor protein
MSALLVSSFLVPSTAMHASLDARSLQPDSTRRDTAVYQLAPVTVISSISRMDPIHAPFSLAVVKAEDIQAQPIRAVSDVLAYIPGVDLRQRGPLGVQSDIAIRGGTFEQTAIMIDGLRLNDVQTGHNTFSIPFLPTDIERIEVVKGGAARSLGSGAMDGAVNIVLKRPTSEPSLQASIMGGDASYREARLSASIGSDVMTHRISAQYMEHAGWVPSSDVALQTAMYNGVLTLGETRTSVILGLSNKAFGASRFYTPNFPEAWEKITTMIGGATLDAPLTDNIDVSLRALARVNDDEFRLKRDDPAFYTNTHRTQQYTVQGRLTRRDEDRATSLLVDAGSDAINSSNLGKHDRVRGSAIIEHVERFGNLRITLGGGVVAFSDRLPLPTGGVDASYILSQEASSTDIVFGSVQTNGRIPTYTDLYYSDPVTTGNPNLVLERATTAEVGYRHATASSMLNVALYARDGRNMIDYVFDSAGNSTAENITTVEIRGLDASYSTTLALGPLSYLRVGLMYQSVKGSAAARTSFVADNLRTQVIVETRWQLPFDIQASYIPRLIERVTTPTLYLVHDVRLMRTFGIVTITAEATNLTDQRYVETGWVVVPPRWARLGAAVTL